MFALHLYNPYEIESVILGVSEDKDKLESLIKEFTNQISSYDGSLLPHKDCPEQITFGRFVLVKDSIWGYYCKEFKTKIASDDWFCIQDILTF
jgi:hypothetical protein